MVASQKMTLGRSDCDWLSLRVDDDVACWLTLGNNQTGKGDAVSEGFLWEMLCLVNISEGRRQTTAVGRQSNAVFKQK